MIVVKFDDQCGLPISKPSCCDECPFFECDDDHDIFGEWTGEFVHQCGFGGQRYTEDHCNRYYDEDGNELDHVIDNNCPIIEITKEEA